MDNHRAGQIKVLGMAVEHNPRRSTVGVINALDAADRVPYTAPHFHMVMTIERLRRPPPGKA
ncbi:MAG TPA: hypothetical protein VIG57_18080 [Candidatus Entotheonella sp.]